MENSKEYLKKHKILPKISFDKGKPRIVKLIEDKQESFTNEKGELVEGMKYKVTENGDPKTIFTTSVALISRLAELEPETEVKITQKGYKQDGEFRTTYEVEVLDNEVPVIEGD